MVMNEGIEQPLMRTLLARQGIFDKNNEVVAYELLYRNNEGEASNLEHANAISGETATSSVLSQLFTNLEIDHIIGNKKAFINFTYAHLIQKVPALLPKDKIVIEVLENMPVDELLISSLNELKKKGYEIALDDFIFEEKLLPLIALADIIKIDVLHLNRAQIAAQLKPLQAFTGKLLAEKIEDKPQHQCCLELGFDLFQGFFLNKPDPFKGSLITESRVQILRLIHEINDKNSTLEHIEKIVLQIPKLSYRLLRLANSVMVYTGKKIDSLKGAIYQLGLLQVRNWLQLLLLASFDELAVDLLERTLIRAKMCELIAVSIDYGQPQQAYMVGILSTLEGILNEPMASLMNRVQLSDSLNEALLYFKGELGQILQLTIFYEQANFNQLEKSTYREIDFTSIYLQAIGYANEVISLILPK